jgi:hypothetical protein
MWEKLRKRDHLDELGVDGRITLRIKDLYEIDRLGMRWIDVAQDKGNWRGFYRHGNEPSGSTKCRDFFLN